MRVLLRLTVVFAALVGMANGVPDGSAQPKKEKDGGEVARFESIDGVELRGRFYASGKPKATVIIVHAVGEDSRKKGWNLLADELHKNGYAVLAFDLRGHGESTDLANPAMFWNQTPWGTVNRAMFRGAPGAQNIAFNEKAVQNKAYYTAFCNDIAAARAYLDRKNDANACDSSNIILVGADTGATLAAIWLNSEYSRYRLKQMPMALPQRDARSLGQDIIGCVFLSPNPKFGAKVVNLPATLEEPGKNRAVPMSFWYGENHKDSKKYAEFMEKSLVKFVKSKDPKVLGKERDPKYFQTVAIKVPGTELTGSELLQKGLGVDQSIRTYLDEVVNNKRNEWVQQEFLKTVYVRPRAGAPLVSVPLNKAGDMNMPYSMYMEYAK